MIVQLGWKKRYIYHKSKSWTSQSLILCYCECTAKMVSQVTIYLKQPENCDQFEILQFSIVDRDHFSGTNVYQWFSENIYQKWNKFQIWDFFFQNWSNVGHMRLCQKSFKIQYIFEKFLRKVNRHNTSDFWIQKFFWLGPFFDLFLNLMDRKNAPSQKSC